MKKSFKKTLCVTLSLCFVFSAFSFASAASDKASDVNSLAFEETDSKFSLSALIESVLFPIGEFAEEISCFFAKEEYTEISKSFFSCKRDDLTIRGSVYKPQGENLPIAIISHPFMANSLFVLQYAKQLARMGYAAFCYDFCGGCVALGKSDGKTTDMSVLTETDDLKAVIEYAKNQPYTDSDNITLMGCSQGGFVSAITAAELKEEIEKLVLFYPALCIPDDARNGKMMLATFDPQNVPEVLYCGPMKLGSQYVTDVLDIDPFEVIAPYPGDVLIVHGTADNVVSLDYAQKALETYNSRATGSAKLEIVEGGGHIFFGNDDKIAMSYLGEYLSLD